MPKNIFMWRHIETQVIVTVGRKPHYASRIGALAAWRNALSWGANFKHPRVANNDVTPYEIVEFEIIEKKVHTPPACSCCKLLLCSDEKTSGICRGCKTKDEHGRFGGA